MCDFFFFYYRLTALVSTHCYLLLVNAFLKLFFLNNAYNMHIFKRCAFWPLFSKHLEHGLRFNTDSHSQGHRSEFHLAQEALLIPVWSSCIRVCLERHMSDHSFAVKSWCSLKHFPMMYCNTNTQYQEHFMKKFFMVIIWPFISCKTDISDFHFLKNVTYTGHDLNEKEKKRRVESKLSLNACESFSFSVLIQRKPTPCLRR